MAPSISKRKPPGPRPARLIGSGSYGVLYMVAGLCAITGAFAILPVRRVR